LIPEDLPPVFRAVWVSGCGVGVGEAQGVSPAGRIPARPSALAFVGEGGGVVLVRVVRLMCVPDGVADEA
jgi:hypothetical protein